MITWKTIKENWNKPQKPQRWNNNYVLKNSWAVCLLPLSNILPIIFVIGVLETIIVICPICNTIKIPGWVTYLFLSGVLGLIFLFIWKILPTYLKGCGLLIYSPNQPNNSEVSS